MLTKLRVRSLMNGPKTRVTLKEKKKRRIVRARIRPKKYGWLVGNRE